MKIFWLGILAGVVALVWLPVKAFQHTLVSGGKMWPATLIALAVIVGLMVVSIVLPTLTWGFARFGMFGALIAGISAAIVGDPQAILPMVVIFVGGGIVNLWARTVARRTIPERPVPMA